MKNIFIRFLIATLLSGCGIAIAASDDVEEDPFREAFNQYYANRMRGSLPDPDDPQTQQQIANLEKMLSGKALSSDMQSFTEELKKEFGSIMFVGGTWLQQSFTGCRGASDGKPMFVNWGRLAIANAARVMVDGTPTISSFSYAYPPEALAHIPRAKWDRIEYNKEALQLLLERLVQMHRVLPCDLVKIPLSYTAEFQTFMLDGSVSYNMNQKELVEGIRRFTKPGSRVIVPLPQCHIDPSKEKCSNDLRSLREELEPDFKFVRLVTNEECQPYNINAHDKDGKMVQCEIPARPAGEPILHTLGGHLLSDWNTSWVLAIWKRVEAAQKETEAAE